MIEEIEWRRVAEEVPDDDEMVLAKAGNGEVTAAVLDAGRWFDLAVGPEWVMEAPVWWAQMPGGPDNG